MQGNKRDPDLQRHNPGRSSTGAPGHPYSIGASPPPAPAPAPDPPIQHPLLGGILALALAMGIGRFAYTPILPAMIRAAHLDPSQAGLLASANYAGYLAGALLAVAAPGGPVRGRILASCLAGTVLTTGMMVLTANPAAWAPIRFLSGLASAGAFVLTSSLVLDLLRRRGAIQLSGWLYGGVGLGIAASGLMVHILDGPLGWRGDWLALAILAAALCTLALALLPAASAPTLPRHPVAASSAGQRGREPGSGDPRRQQPSSPGHRIGAPLALLLAAYFLEGTGYVVTGTFLVAIVNAMPGLSGTGPSVWIVVGLAAAPSCLLWARLAGRAGHIPALTLAYLAQAGGIVLPVLGGGIWIAVVAAICFGGTFLGITTLTITLAGQLAPGRSTALIGLATAIFGLGQIAGPLLAGTIASRAHSYSPALLAASALVLSGGGLVAALSHPRLSS